MSLLSAQIEQVLKQYDQRKGFFRRLFGDHPAIKALRKLTPTDQDNIFKIYQCFVENLPKEHQASHFAYEALMMHISKGKRLSYTTESLKLLIQENLTTQNISNFVNKNIAFPCFLPSLEFLKRSNLLTERNLIEIDNSSVIDRFNSFNIFILLNFLTKSSNFGPLTQERFNIIRMNDHLWNMPVILNPLRDSDLLSPQNLDRILQLSEDNFLFSHAGYQTVWERLPRHLLTQEAFERLITLSQQTNPSELLRQFVNQQLEINQQNQGVNINRERITINDGQSTHYASVHQSVSDSASKLFNLYGQWIEAAGLQNILQMIVDYIRQLPDDSLKNMAAKRCIERIINLSHTDLGSDLTIQQLLALSFLAVHDSAKRIGDLADARKQFVEGLYEIQRGYNLSESGADYDGTDDPICNDGTFNKLIEKLEGIHPDVQVLHITPAIASLKLPIVVREVARDYLSSIAEPNTIEGFRRFMQLIEQIRQDEYVSVIWDQIKTKIVDRMFSEFGSLYHGKTDSRLIDLVENGQYLKLENLSCFQEQIIASPGYKKHCSQVLRCSLNFFSSQHSTVGSDVICFPESSHSRRPGS